MSLIWITGASSGIGRALAEKMAASGAKVAITARRADELQAIAATSPRLLPMPGDVTDAAAMATLIETLESAHGPITQAVLNAGTYTRETTDNWTVESFRRQVEVNLLGTVHGLVPLLARMKARGSGQVAIVSSVAGYTGLPGSLGYGATKAALINLAEALAVDAGRYGVKIQVINPGFVKTPLTDKNEFPMPFLVPVDEAATIIMLGLQSNRFEIAFPWPMVASLKFIRRLPYPLYLRLQKKLMGW